MSWYSESIFPTLYDTVVERSPITPHRAPFLANAYGTVLELGVGSGLNLRHYPASISKLIAIDPSHGMLKRLTPRTKKVPYPVETIPSNACPLPLPDHSVDTVISFLTLCSVKDLPTVLRECHRVLRTDGRFLFFEHGIHPKSRIAQWQHRFNPIQRQLFAGCQLHINPVNELEAAGFTVQHLDNFQLTREFPTHGWIYRGTAIPKV